MTEETVLMKGNEAIAHAAIRYGCDGFFGYPITPQSEILETLTLLKPWETTGMVVLQAESEVASINMVYGGAGSGKMVMTSSSSPGVSLMQEGISYMAGAELPGLIVNVMRGGPGLGTIQPSQADYFQAVKGGGNGDYHLITLAPASVQEMADFTGLAFELAFKYRNPAILLSDGVIGQMMEKVTLPAARPRRTEAEIIAQCPWATTGRVGRKRNVITSLELRPEEIAFLNAHGTGTRSNDACESAVFERVFGPDVRFLSTKGMTGHTLGAAGVLELIFSRMMLQEKVLPASPGFRRKGEDTPLAPVAEKTAFDGKFAISTSLGFGGCNTALIVGEEC